MKNNTYLSILFFFSFSTLIAQSQISGKVIDKGNGEGLVGAAVVIDGTTRGILTDIEGNFTLPVEAGTYTISISFLSYETGKVQVVAKANEVAYVNFAMTESKNELQEVIIVATPERSSSVAMMIERKKAAQVSDGITADLIRKTPDRTTSDVLKRITGATIQENKFAIIRGMNDRYNAGYLDGALLPSTESDRKAFAFDVVPASLIDNLVILKAGSPDLIGDFGGGIIKINTKAIPEKMTQNLSIGAQIHSLTSFKDFTQFKRYPSEAFNILGTERNIPDFTEGSLKTSGVFPTAEDKGRLATISQKFNNDWSNSAISAMPNMRLSYSLGMPIRIAQDKKLGLILAVNYANTRRFSTGNVNSFDGAGQTAAFNDNSSLQNISSGGLLNLNYVGSKTQVNFRNLLNFNTDNNTIYRTGTGNVQDALTVRNTANLINYNRLYNSIVSLKQIVGENLFTINTSVNYSNVRRKVPDYRIVSYTKTPDFENYRLALGDFFNTSTGRFASDLNESIYGGGGGGGSSTSTGGNGVFNPANFGSCTIMNQGFFEQIFGESESCYDYYNDNRRVKVKYFNQNFGVFSSIGCSTRLQKREHLNLLFGTISWWEKSYAQQIRMGVNNMTYTYNFNVPVYNSAQYNYETTFFEYKNVKYNINGQVIPTIPTSAGSFNFPVDNNDNVIDITVLGYNAMLTNGQVNQAIDAALVQIISSINTFALKQELITKKAEGNLVVRTVYVEPFSNKIKFIVANQFWASNDDNAVVKYFDFNFLLTYNSSTNYNPDTTQEYIDLLETFNGARTYTDVKIDMFGAALYNNYWKGRKLLKN